MEITILVVEDDETIRQVVSEYLKEAGFSVLQAEDGHKAADIIAGRKDIDLFILDIMLPGLSGLELLKMIRESRDEPVIMLTALTDEHTQINSFDKKADDYVTKPFSPKVLVKRVEAVLYRSGKLTPLLKLDDISIDVENYEAFEEGRNIMLTLKELEILKVLISSRKKVLSRQQLLDMVWGSDYFGDERIVDAHIKNLRKKFNRDIIATVKGIGYKIREKDTV